MIRITTRDVLKVLDDERKRQRLSKADVARKCEMQQASVRRALLFEWDRRETLDVG